jgi:Trk K+ transport system NAD-binding subunit
MRVLVLGGGDLASEVCSALEAGGASASWLRDVTDESVATTLPEGFDVVCVATREDAFPLRMALLVRHLDADVRLVVTIFDPAMAAQVRSTIPDCTVTSVAEIVAPSLAGPCLNSDIVAVRHTDSGWVGLDAELEEVPLPAVRARKARALVEAVFRPFDRSTGLLFYGALGLVLMLLFEWFGSVIVLDQALPDALYGSTKSLATVGPNPAIDDGPKWFKVAIVASMLLTLLSAACFTGGLINRLVDSSLTGLVGRRAVPRRDHVVVVGLGQVGLRLCLLLRACGVPVVAVDTEAEGENVGFARRVKLPVVIGRGANPAVLRRLSLSRALGFAAVTPDDLNNIEAGVAARAADVRVVLRAGDGHLCDETASLRRIGDVVDVHRLGAAFIAGLCLGKDVSAVAIRDGRPHLLLSDREWEAFPMDVFK